MNIYDMRSVGDEILNMLFELCPIGLLVVCYCFSDIKASYFGLVMYTESGE